MISHNKNLKGIVLNKHIITVEGYIITWSQMISKKGGIYGIGSFQQKMQQTKEQQRRGNWGKTLERRINARHEKGENWKDY